MDLWVVAAAAGAGYVAKANYLKNFPSKFSLESHAFECVHGQQNSWNLLHQIRHKSCPLCRLAALKESYGKSEVDKSNESLAETKQKASTFQRLTNCRQLKRGSNDYVHRDLYPYESSVAAEMHRMNTRFEECENELRPLPGTAMDVSLTEERTQIDTQSSLLTGPPKRSSNNAEQSRRLSRYNSSTLPSSSPHTQGSLNGLLLFLLGATVGLMYAVAANKNEVDGLNDTLKQNMKLVQDLHDELEMKDVLTVTEIANDNGKMQGSGRGRPPMFRTKQEEDESTSDEKPANSEAMREIEAELEAELVRLELSLKSSTLEEYYDSVEAPDQEEEKEMTDEKPAKSSDSDYYFDETYFGVSPKELSLRLHEVIQSRLEARIIELEAAVEKNQRRLRALESASNGGDQHFSDEAETSPDQKVQQK